jgi:formylglycine-generating enzyme required for sulfatase activity
MKFLKIGGVLIAAVILTTLAIDASDALSGKGGTLLGQLAGIENSACPEGMIHVLSALTFTCVDEYEASTGPECAFKNPSNQFDTISNIDQPECKAVSAEDLEPWRNITREQALLACARSGKRLPDAEEWYQFALGTPSAKCNIASQGVEKNADSNNSCVSAVLVRNAVGNVWEWVSGDVTDGNYKDRVLPESGYVTQVDSGGLATVTDKDQSSELFDEDYFWTNSTGIYAMIRGGFYGSRSDAGVYSVHAHTKPTFSGNAIGFRCVR